MLLPRFGRLGGTKLREIGIITGEKEASVLADYLLTLNITTKLEPRPDGWVLWVHREDRVPEAHSILADFQANPADPRFQAATRTAREIRKQAEKVEKEHRKKVKDFRERWEGAIYHRAPISFGLIVASIVVTAIQHTTQSWDYPVFDRLSFSVLGYDAQGAVVDTGFAKIRHGELWRLITPIFMHGGLVHLFFNMLAMRYLGEQVEMRKGPWRFILIALVAAIVGNVGQFYNTGGSFCGMSGVVFALAGYLWIKGHADPEDGLSLDQRSVNWMLAWFLLGIIAPLTAGPNPPNGFPYNMANVAHGVGLAAGMVFGLMKL